MNKHYPDADLSMMNEIYNYELNTKYLFVTTGKTGSCFFDGSSFYRQPVYKSDIVDTIGAGDTFFSFASLISVLPDPKKYLNIPGIAASLSTTWLCNEYSVNKNNLKEHASKYL
jgi:sugar/nucleoside kinase (ribokinase family)